MNGSVAYGQWHRRRYRELCDLPSSLPGFVDRLLAAVAPGKIYRISELKELTGMSRYPLGLAIQWCIDDGIMFRHVPAKTRQFQGALPHLYMVDRDVLKNGLND